MLDHPGANRVEFDVSITPHHVVFFVGKTGSEPPLPERAATTIGAVDVLHVALAESLHQLPDTAGCFGGEQQMDMIRHQRIRMNHAALGLGVLLQPFKIEAVVVFRIETGLPVIATLDDVNRDLRKHDAWTSGHNSTGAKPIVE